MFPSEMTPLAGRVGLVVGETVLGLYVRSVEGGRDGGAVDLVAVAGVVTGGPVVTGEPGSVGPPEDGGSVCGETAELLSAPEEQAVTSEAHRIATTAATRRPRHLWARRTIGGTGGVRAGRMLSPGCAGP